NPPAWWRPAPASRWLHSAWQRPQQLGQALNLRSILQPDSPTLRTDYFNRPAQGRYGEADFLKLYLRRNGVTFQAQPFAQGGQSNTMTSGKVPLLYFVLVEKRQQPLPLFRSPTPAA